MAPKTNIPAKRRTSHIRLTGTGSSATGQRFVQLSIAGQEEATSVLARIDNWNATSGPERLNLHGANLIDQKTRNEFTARLQRYAGRSERFKVAIQPGWHGNRFVLPHGVFGKGPRVAVYLDELDPDTVSKFRVAGDQDQWLQLAELAPRQHPLHARAGARLRGARRADPGGRAGRRSAGR